MRQLNCLLVLESYGGRSQCHLQPDVRVKGNCFFIEEFAVVCFVTASRIRRSPDPNEDARRHSMKSLLHTILTRHSKDIGPNCDMKSKGEKKKNLLFFFTPKRQFPKMLFEAVPVFNSPAAGQMLYNPNKDPLWPEIQVCSRPQPTYFLWCLCDRLPAIVSCLTLTTGRPPCPLLIVCPTSLVPTEQNFPRRVRANCGHARRVRLPGQRESLDRSVLSSLEFCFARTPHRNRYRGARQRQRQTSQRQKEASQSGSPRARLLFRGTAFRAQRAILSALHTEFSLC